MPQNVAKLTSAKNSFLESVRRAARAGRPTEDGSLVVEGPHLVAEAAALRRTSVIVALGRIAFDAAWRLLGERGIALRPRPAFGHGLVYHPSGGPVVIASYHPSRQNTNTRKLTPAMLNSIFETAARLARSGA